MRGHASADGRGGSRVPAGENDFDLGEGSMILTAGTWVHFESVGSIVDADLRSGVGGGKKDVLLQGPPWRRATAGRKAAVELISWAWTMVDGGLRDAGIINFEKANTVTMDARGGDRRGRRGWGGKREVWQERCKPQRCWHSWQSSCAVVGSPAAPDTLLVVAVVFLKVTPHVRVVGLQ